MFNCITVKVSTVKTLQNVLSKKYPIDFNQIILRYHTLQDFITIAKLELNDGDTIELRLNGWQFEVMTETGYKNDTRSLPPIKLTFLLDKQHTDDEAYLFVMHKGCSKITSNVGGLVASNDTPTKNPLEQEIIDLNKNMSILQDSYAKRAAIKSKIVAMLNRIWRNKDIRVSIFGSSANGLATENADIDLCITGPSIAPTTESLRNILKNIPESIYNMNYLAMRLHEIGMDHIEAINDATVPICKFRDPQFGLYCDINTNNLLGVENTNLLIQYMHLDARVRPFLFALKYFVKSKEINNSRKGFLSSYAFILMGLHYLMFVQSPPIIPCLQRLSGATCVLTDCNFNRQGLVDACDVRYHDCVRIENTLTDAYNSATVSPQSNPTVWYSANTKNVGDLVLDAFNWLSSLNNLITPMSVTTNGNIVRQHNWRKHDLIFPDPFVSTRNISGSCTAVEARVICQEFTNARDKLKKGMSFESVCDPNDRVKRPVDTKSMDYRFGSGKKNNNGYNSTTRRYYYV